MSRPPLGLASHLLKMLKTINTCIARLVGLAERGPQNVRDGRGERSEAISVTKGRGRVSTLALKCRSGWIKVGSNSNTVPWL